MLDSGCANACAPKGLPGPMRHWYAGFTQSHLAKVSGKYCPFSKFFLLPKPCDMTLVLRALSAARQGMASAPGCGSPARVTGLTHVVSMASFCPWYKPRPLATFSRRRASLIGSSKFMSAEPTLPATRTPASWQTRATAVSKASPSGRQVSRWRPQVQRRGTRGRGRRSRRRRATHFVHMFFCTFCFRVCFHSF